MTIGKKPYIYTQEHRMNGATSSSTAVIPNNGINQITAASTYTLAGPRIGSMVTIYAASTVAQGGIKIVSTSSSGQAAFNSAGGTQALNLITNTTLNNQDICVTLFGEATTQWRVMSVWPQRAASSTLEGVFVTT
jgi:hypothetical protein